VHGDGVDDPIAWCDGASATNKRDLFKDDCGSVIEMLGSGGPPRALDSDGHLH